jgi:hypothetical protein
VTSIKKHLIRKVQRLGKIPLKDFTNEDLRLMIGQQFSLKFIVPIALERLVENEFISGDMYTGDLVYNLLNINHDFWLKNEDLHYEFNSIIIGVKHTIETLTPALEKFIPPQ